MLTIINDPTGATGWQRHEWDYSLSIQQNIERHLPSGEGCLVRLNGLPIDPAQDPVMDAKPRQTDDVMIARRPEGFDPITWAIIAIIATTAVVYSLMPKVNPANAAVGKDSPNNRLTGQTNTARAYQGIPDVYGSRRVWPDLVQPSVVEYIDHVKYVTEIMCISRGEGVVSNVRYSDSDVVSGSGGASFEVFAPAAGAGYAETRQTSIPNVVEAFSVPDVDGQEITPATMFRTFQTPDFPFLSRARWTLSTTSNPQYVNLLLDADSQQIVDLFARDPTAVFWISTIPTFETPSITLVTALLSVSVSGGRVYITFNGNPFDLDVTDAPTTLSFSSESPVSIASTGPFLLPTSADAIRWNVVFLRSLKGVANITATFWKVDADGLEIAGTRQSVARSYSDNTFDARYFTEDVTPTAGSGRYRVQFERTNGENGDGTDAAKLEAVSAVKRYAVKQFPGVTMLRITTRATEAATAARERKINLQWSRRVRGLRTETVSESSNFARIIAHLWSIAGRDAEQLDLDALEVINAAHGASSPLLSFNGSFDDADMAIGERVRIVADHARCIVWRDGNKWSFVRDERRAFPVAQFDYLNLAPAEPSLSFAAHLPSTHDSVEVEFVEPASQARKDYIRLRMSGGGVVSGVGANALKIRLPGCTSPTQATNRANLEIRRLMYQRQSLKIQTLSDGMDLAPGSLIRWIDPDDFYADDSLQAGEVISISGDVVTTSEPLRWDGQTQGRILLTGADGRYIGAPVLCTPTDGGAKLASVPSGLFTAGGVRQLGSRYAFAVGLTAAELEAASLWTVTSARPEASGAVSVACASYDARIYEADPT
jgi:hypothetical protein